MINFEQTINDIDKLAREYQQQELFQHELFEYFRIKLAEGSVAAEIVLDYAGKYTWISSRLPVVQEDTINKLGVVVSELGAAQEKLASEFYKLAAERGSSYGSANYANYLLQVVRGTYQSLREALIYAERAVELTENTSNSDRSSQQWAYYIVGQCYEKLGKSSDAWLAYCKVVDDKLYFYKGAIATRKRLLKHEVEKLMRKTPMPDLASLDINDENETDTKAKRVNGFILPQGIPLPAKFGASWHVESKWFHSIDESGMQQEFHKRLGQVGKLIEAKETERLLIKEICGNSISAVQLQKNQAVETELHALREIEKELNEKYNRYQPTARLSFRRHATETHFFNPHRSKKVDELIALVHEIIDHRYRVDVSEPLALINLEGRSGRLLITAERVFQEAIISLSSSQNPKLGIPIARRKPYSFKGRWGNHISGETPYGPVEIYQVGDTRMQSEHRTEPKRQRLGDSYLPEHGTYSGWIFPKLDAIANGEPDKEKQLAQFMIRYGRTHQSVTLAELTQVQAAATQEDVNNFNKICFLIMEKEQSQWHSATSERFHFGMTVAQARCLRLIEVGFLSFEDAFKNNVLFGVYSRKKIMDNSGEVAKSCQYIDDMYLLYLKSTREKSLDYAQFFKKHVDKQPAPTCVLTREQAHQDMLYVYSGESDTDTEDDGYDTDLSM